MTILIPAALLAATFSVSEPESPADTGARQPEVIVTASRAPESTDDALASTTVITRAQLEQSAVTDLVQVLREVAGIDITRTGGVGQSTGVLLRGTASNQTLVLIDGVRVSSSNSGLFDFAHLPPDQIERIEIVRGPRAAYWGSDAIGGVIQIFTRQPGAPAVRAYGGRYGLAGASASVGVSDDRGSIGVTVGGETLDGYSATRPEAFGYDPDRDGYYNRNVSLRGAMALGTQQLSLSGLSTDADVDFDQGRTSALNQSLGLTVSGELAAGWRHELVLGQSREELDTPDFFSRYTSRRTQLDWQHRVAMSDPLQLVFGVNLEHGRGESLNTFAGEPDYEATRNARAGYVGVEARGEHADAQLIVRHTRDQSFGNNTSPAMAAGWRFSDAWRVYGSYGQGFRAPGLNELYSPGFGGLFAGNPDLEPERSRSAEVGAEWLPGENGKVTASLYRTRLRDLVSFSGGETFQAINVNRARIDGAEIAYSDRCDAWDWRGSATWQDAEDQGTGQPLLRRPRRKGAVQLGYAFEGGTRLEAHAQAVSERSDFAGTLAGYALYDLVARVPLPHALTLEVRLDNLTDRDYQLVQGYATPGRSLFLGVSYDGAAR